MEYKVNQVYLEFLDQKVNLDPKEILVCQFKVQREWMEALDWMDFLVLRENVDQKEKEVLLVIQ